MSYHRLIQTTTVMIFIISSAIIRNAEAAIPDVAAFSAELDSRTKQTVLSGLIDSFTVVRGTGVFRLGPGKLTFFNFGAYRPSAMVYFGEGSFNYFPPDRNDRAQFSKPLGSDSIDVKFKSICIYYNIEFDRDIDTSGFIRAVVGREPRVRLVDSQRMIIEHLGIFTQSKLAGDILAKVPGSFFLAEFETKDQGQLIFCEDPSCDDLFRLYRLQKSKDEKTCEILSGYSPDANLPSQRGTVPIDITQYRLKGNIDKEGELELQCKIHFKSLKGGIHYLEFKLSDEMKALSAFDSRGNPLGLISRKNARSLGLALNTPLDLMTEDSVEISLLGKPFEYEWKAYYSADSVYWYPENIVRDYATFEINITCPKNLQLVSNGFPADAVISEGQVTASWSIDRPISKAQFYMGLFLDLENTSDRGKQCKMIIPIAPSWGNDTLSLGTYIENDGYWRRHYELLLLPGVLSKALSTARQALTSSKTLRDLDVFEEIFGKSIDSVICVEDSRGHLTGSGGLIGLSTESDGLVRVADPLIRAHETAHQWWGENVAVESYRDLWIIEGLAEYSAYLAMQHPINDEKVPQDIPGTWQTNIFNDSLFGSYPLWVIPRMKNFSGDEFNNYFFSKSAYIFYMLNYLLWDYENKSDTPFMSFLRDLSEKYRLKPITGRKLQSMLEARIDQDMSWFFDEWIYDTAIPTYSFEYEIKTNGSGEYVVACDIEQDDVPVGFGMYVPIALQLENYSLRYHRVWIDQPETRLELPPSSIKPIRAIFNPNDAVLCRVTYK